MLVAPHPDDEALACSIILQRAVRAGAAVRVLYATDGENNPWPQRASTRKWRIAARDRHVWGRLRRIEARRALRAIGVGDEQAHFLGLPDQGLRELLRRRCNSTFSLLRSSIAAWDPTLLLVPTISDTHADHHALGTMLQLIRNQAAKTTTAVPAWSYQVHGRSRPSSHARVSLLQSPAEAAVKVSAIQCHKTQLMLSRQRFLGYASRAETFESVPPVAAGAAEHPMRCFDVRARAAAEAGRSEYTRGPIATPAHQTGESVRDIATTVCVRAR